VNEAGAARCATTSVVMVGPVPPPVHGQALADQILFEGSYHRFHLEPVGLRFSSGINDVGRARAGKVLTLGRALINIRRARRRTSAETLVYSVGAKNLVGVVRDTVLLLAVRPAFDHTILHVHTGGIDDLLAGAPGWLRGLARRAYGRTDAVIHLSPGPPEAVFTTRRWFFLPNGVDVPAAVDDVVRRNPVCQHDPPRVLFLGNLYESKGPGVLLDACEELARRGLDVEVVLAGGAPDEAYKDRLLRRIEGSTLDGRVRLTGSLAGDEKWAALLEADVFCFPTYYEGEALPLAIIEAMACARPIVASDWRSIGQLVQHGATGLLVPPRDVGALADGLARLLAEPDLARSLGTAARRRYEAGFTVGRFRAGFEDIVATTLGLPRSVAGTWVTPP